MQNLDADDSDEYQNSGEDQIVSGLKVQDFDTRHYSLEQQNNQELSPSRPQEDQNVDPDKFVNDFL